MRSEGTVDLIGVVGQRSKDDDAAVHERCLWSHYTGWRVEEGVEAEIGRIREPLQQVRV